MWQSARVRFYNNIYIFLYGFFSSSPPRTGWPHTLALPPPPTMPNPPSATVADDETQPGERNAERPLTRRRTGRRRRSRAPPPHNTLALAHAHDPSAAPATDISIIVLGEIFWVGACALPPPPTPNRFGCPRRADEAVRPFASPPIFNAPRTEHGRRPRAAGAHHFFFFSYTPLPFFFYRNPLAHTHTRRLRGPPPPLRSSPAAPRRSPQYYP